MYIAGKPHGMVPGLGQQTHLFPLNPIKASVIDPSTPTYIGRFETQAYIPKDNNNPVRLILCSMLF